LFAGLALQNQQGCLIICNGYKDALFIRMALMGIKLGKKVVMVVEKLEELKQIIAVSRQMGVEPLIGIRVRLMSKGAGKWADSGGENAKFGLNTAELVAATEILRAEKMEHCFKLLHFHIGSQVPDIVTIKKAVQEAARFYAKLYKMGFAIESLDVGGGLGVDYDGSRSAFDSSTNYTLQEYTNDIVFYIGEVCNQEQVPHPQIVSESGRAIVAHHSVLLVETLGTIEKIRAGSSHFVRRKRTRAGARLAGHPQEPPQSQQTGGLSRRHRPPRGGAAIMFALGMLDLPDKAKIETLYWEIGREVVQSFRGQALRAGGNPQAGGQPGRPGPVQFLRLPIPAGSLGLGPAFPHHAREPPERKAHPRRHAGRYHLRFRRRGQKVHRPVRRARHAPLHAPRPTATARSLTTWAFFLMGAYQDIMGDLHNLFGRVNEVHVFLDPDEAGRLLRRGNHRRLDHRPDADLGAVRRKRIEAADEDADRRGDQIRPPQTVGRHAVAG
jgi:arginine decarboxylase